jgi:branched-chain amino acid aminotransferase
MNADLVAINGQIFKPEDAKISVFDRGFLFGDAVYEVTRSYGRILYQIEPHIQRLYQSAEKIGMDLEISEDEAIRELYRIYRLVDKDDKYLRVQVTRGEGAIGMSSQLATKRNWVVYIKDIDRVPQEFYDEGVAIVTSQRHRNTKLALDPNIKSGNYLNNVLAFQDAAKYRAFEAVMVDNKGFITEGTTSNIFRVERGVIYTPPTTSDLLKGITRATVFEIARQEKLELIESHFTPRELRDSDEVFLTSSTREVLPVATVDGTKIKSHRAGVVTQKIAKAYKQAVAYYCERAKQTHPWN